MASWFTPEAKQAFGIGKMQTTDTYKMALYTGAVPSSGTGNFPAYTATNEVANGNGYATGGGPLSGYSQSLQSGVWTLDFTTPTWPSATFSATYGAIYDNTTATKYAIGVYDFGGTITATAATFTVTMPTSGSGTSIIRIQ